MIFRSQILDLVPENNTKADKQLNVSAIYKLIQGPWY